MELWSQSVAPEQQINAAAGSDDQGGGILFRFVVIEPYLAERASTRQSSTDFTRRNYFDEPLDRVPESS